MPLEIKSWNGPLWIQRQFLSVFPIISMTITYSCNFAHILLSTKVVGINWIKTIILQITSRWRDPLCYDFQQTTLCMNPKIIRSEKALRKASMIILCQKWTIWGWGRRRKCTTLFTTSWVVGGNFFIATNFIAIAVLFFVVSDDF